MPPFEKVENDNEEIIENWDGPVSLHEEDDLYKLLKVAESENRRIDVDIQELYDNRFIGTATGKSLNKIGDLVGIKRKSNEENEKLRKRIKAGFAAKASDTTYDTFVKFVLSMLETDSSTITISTPPESQPKEIDLKIDGAVLGETLLTDQEVSILLNGAVSVDAKVNISRGGTFAFAGDDDTLKGFDDGTWSNSLN